MSNRIGVVEPKNEKGGGSPNLTPPFLKVEKEWVLGGTLVPLI